MHPLAVRKLDSQADWFASPSLDTWLNFAGEAANPKQYAQIPGTGALQDVTDSSFTMEVEFSLDSLPTNTDSNTTRSYVFGRTGFHVGIFVSPTGFVRAGLYVMNGATATEVQAGGPVIVLGARVIASMVVDVEAQLITVYVNGTKHGSTPLSGLLPRDMGITSYHLGGAHPISTGFRQMSNGKIYEARLWSRALSAEEVWAPLTGEEEGLAGWWPITERAGTVLTDRGPLGVNGTIVNATWGQGDYLDLTSEPGSIKLKRVNLVPDARLLSGIKVVTSVAHGSPGIETEWYGQGGSGIGGPVTAEVVDGAAHVVAETVNSSDVRAYSPVVRVDKIKEHAIRFKRKVGPGHYAPAASFDLFAVGGAVDDQSSSQRSLRSGGTTVTETVLADGWREYEVLVPKGWFTGSGNWFRVFFGNGWNLPGKRDFYIKDLQVKEGAQAAYSPYYALYSSITTKVLDLGTYRPTIQATWGAEEPAGASVGAEYRLVGKNGTAGPWAALTDEPINDVRQIQFRFTLSSDGVSTPTVEEVELILGGLMLFINGKEYTAHLRTRTFSGADRLNERSTLDFALNAEAADGLTPFDPVLVVMDGEVAFEGSIHDSDEARLVEVEGEKALVVDVRCVDLHKLADRRRVPETYDGWKAGAIVKDLLNKYLAIEGVQAGVIHDGPTITRAVFGYAVTLTDAMQELAELAGFVWRLRPGATGGRFLDFASQVDDVAPFEVNETAPIKGFKLRRHRDGYRNREIVRAGLETTDPRTESFLGDGESRTYTLAFAVAQKPSLIVDGVPVPPGEVGIRGLETAGKTWFWNKGDPVISHGDDQTPVPAGNKVEINYRGQFPIIVELEDAAEIAARQAEEGGSGIYEEVDSVGVDSSDAARQYAQGKLTQHARLNGEIRFGTQRSGLRAGQLIPVDMPAHNLLGTYLISEVTLTDQGLGYDGTFSYQVTALDGSAVGGWVQFFRNLARQGEKFSIRDNEVLVRMKAAGDSLGVLDTFTREAGAPSNEVGFAEVEFSEVAP